MTEVLEVLGSTYAAVFLAEIVGDKLLYTSGVLATRFRWKAIVAGMAMAFMGKMSVAVALGAAVGTLLPVWMVALLTAASFVSVALTMWRHQDGAETTEPDDRFLKGAMLAFATIFFSEWGDKGMISAGAMAATWFSAAPSLHLSPGTVAFVVWAAAVAAMSTKGCLAVTLGATIRRWLAAHVTAAQVRYVSVTAMCLLGVLSVLEVMGIVTD